MAHESEAELTPELETWLDLSGDVPKTGNANIDSVVNHALLATWLDNEGHGNLAVDELVIYERLRISLGESEKRKVDAILEPKKKTMLWR
jgi:hypothetical protein